jgi:cytoskeletal protein RodZ
MEPNTNQPVSQMMSSPHKKVGPIVAILVIVLILIIGALYIFASRVSQPTVPTDNVTAAKQTPSDGAVQPATGGSDDVTSLSKDLNTSTTGLDKQNF